MKISLFDGMFEFDFDWKAVIGVGIIILGCALLVMWGGISYWQYRKEMDAKLNLIKRKSK